MGLNNVLHSALGVVFKDRHPKWHQMEPCEFKTRAKQLALGWFNFDPQPYGCGSKPMVPFWGRCTTHFRSYFSGDWDVHWTGGTICILTHGLMGVGGLLHFGVVRFGFHTKRVAQPTT